MTVETKPIHEAKKNALVSRKKVEEKYLHLVFFKSVFRSYSLFFFNFFWFFCILPCFFFCLFVCFLKLKIYFLIKIQLCRRVSDKIFSPGQFPETRLLFLAWLLFRYSLDIKRRKNAVQIWVWLFDRCKRFFNSLIVVKTFDK